jgi:hypothetical protein
MPFNVGGGQGGDPPGLGLRSGGVGIRVTAEAFMMGWRIAVAVNKQLAFDSGAC